MHLFWKARGSALIRRRPRPRLSPRVCSDLGGNRIPRAVRSRIRRRARIGRDAGVRRKPLAKGAQEEAPEEQITPWIPSKGLTPPAARTTPRPPWKAASARAGRTTPARRWRAAIPLAEPITPAPTWVSQPRIPPRRPLQLRRRSTIISSACKIAASTAVECVRTVAAPASSIGRGSMGTFQRPRLVL